MPRSAEGWIKQFSTKDDADVALFCFPHAGGAPHAYRDWSFADELGNVEVLCISPPGRGARHADPTAASMDEMVDGIVDAMLKHLSMPFGFFGHSLGALVAYKVARGLADRGLPGPLFLVASASESPAAQAAQAAAIASGAADGLSSLSDAGFLRRVGTEWGFVEPSLAENPALVAIALPALRADIAVWESFEDDTAQAPLDLAVLALGGADDRSVPKAALAGWAAVTSQPLELDQLPGGHFYTASHQPELLTLLQRHIALRLAALPLSVAIGPQNDHADAFGKCVHELFVEAAAVHVEKEAVIGLERTLSYAELDDESTLLARRLQELGLGLAQNVGIYIPHSEEYLIANIAIFKAGGAMFLIETNYTADLIADFVRDGGVDIVLTTAAMAPNLPDGLTVLELDGTGWVEQLRADPGLPVYTKPALTPKSPAYLTMTSGSTGKPKAVVNDHLGAVVSFFGRFDLYPYDSAGEREGLNVFFAWESLRAVLVGHTAVIIPDTVIFDPKRLLAFIRERRITRLMVTPSLMATILETPGIDFGYFLGHMKAWYMEGEVLPMRTVTRFKQLCPGVQMINIYASWEALDNTYATVTSDAYAASNALSLFAPAGTPMPHVQLYICDAEMRIRRMGQSGDVYIATKAMFHGYLNDPGKTAAKLIENPWAGRHTDPAFGGESYVHSPQLYNTGDRGRIRPDGQFEVSGRSDFTVKIRAFKVAFGMVEQSILDLDGVAHVCVAAKLDDVGQAEDLIAYVIGSEPGVLLTLDAQIELQSALAAKLPDYAVPAYWVPMTAFPQKGGESRKLDRRALPPPGPEHLLAKQASNSAVSSTRASLSAMAPTPSGDALHDEILAIFKRVLSEDDIAATDNFFDVGGHSLMAATLVGELNNLGIGVAITDLYQHPSAAGLAALIQKATAPAEIENLSWRRGRTFNAGKVAIVGMAGEFPGASSVAALWENLKAKHDAVVRLSPEDYAGKSIPRSTYEHPGWVNAAYVCPDAAKFDAGFFGIGPREAEIMDPQHRRFLQCAWEAMEASGYAPLSGSPRSTAVFAAAGIDGYMHHHLDGKPLKMLDDPGAIFLGEVGSEKDYIATRVSYALDVSGPSVNVQSACSSGLVAVAQAAQALQTGNCELAVAGAASLSFPNFGYMYGEGLVGSTDGKVRPFDANASGTLFGDAVGAVVLKRLEDAERDGDFVWAVLSGSAVTNDGRQKAAYSAPSALAQESAILLAQEQANVTADEVSYVECHATATLLGDGIEMSGLAGAFGKNKNKPDSSQAADGDVFPGTPPAVAVAEAERWCALGSIKGNIGHANCAAGITGLIKAALCVHHKTLVPTAHFEEANPKLGLSLPDRDPFFINTELRPWDLPAHLSKRVCGVSSFGIGGTNCHVVLEEFAPPAETLDPPPVAAAANGGYRLLTLSAKSIESLKGNLLRMAEYLVSNAEADLAVVADVLHRGRDHFQFRAAIVADSVESAIANMRAEADAITSDRRPCAKAAKTVFVFPGQGSQFVRMGQGLYASVPVFARHFDECAALAELRLPGQDIRTILYQDGDAIPFTDPVVVQACLFATEYALAKTLIEFGVKPAALAGHSIGEYAAATIAGVVPLDAAIEMVVVRASSARDDCEGGTMLSASLSGAEAVALATEVNAGVDAADGRIYLACINDPARVVFSGKPDVVVRAKALLDASGQDRYGRAIKTRQLHVTHAFHSSLMAPAADKIRGLVDGLNDASSDGPAFAASQIPVTSNVTGGWMGDETLRGDYWAEQIVGSVQWVKNVEAVLRWKPTNIVEVGPGTTLGFFVNQIVAKTEPALKDMPAMLYSMRHAKAVDESDVRILTALIGSLWESGVAVDWDAYHGNAPMARDPRMPTYDWNEQTHWCNPEASVYVKELAPKPDLKAKQMRAGTQGSKKNKKPKKKKAKVPASDMLVRYSNGAQRRGATPTRLYCFPYAGGSSRAFEAWANAPARPDWLDVVAVEMPMRGTRADEEIRPSSDADDAAETKKVAALIAGELEASPGSQAALCGLSMGALAAVEVFAELVRLGHASRLVNLTIAGRAVPSAADAAGSYDMGELNLAGDAVTESEAWETYLKPLLEGDLGADARASGRVAGLLSGRGAVACDVQVHCGIQDASFPFMTASKWQKLQAPSAEAKFDVSYYPEGHGFLVDRSLEIFAKACVWLQHQRSAAQVVAPTNPSILHSVKWRALASPVCVCPADSEFSVVRLVPRPGPPDIPCLIISNGKANMDLPAALQTSMGLVVVVGETQFAPDQQCTEELEECWLFTQLLQHCVEQNFGGKLVLVAPAAVSGAMSVGVSKAFALEHPDIQFQRVFYSTDTAPHSLECIKEIAHTSSRFAAETDMWVEKTQNDVFRVLAPRAVVVADAAGGPGFSLSAKHILALCGKYLVTGGTGGVGTAMIAWLIDELHLEPSSIHVLCRNASSVNATALAERGVSIIQLDVGDYTAVLASKALGRLGRVDGIFHLAGILEDGLVSNMTQASLCKVVGPKAVGISALLAKSAAAGWNPDFVLNFSSTSSLLGYPGQANYCAANAMLDQMAVWGVPGSNLSGKIVTINWGPWGEAGMAGPGTKAHAQALKEGDYPLANKAAFAQMQRVLGSLAELPFQNPEYMVCDVEWERSPWRSLPLVQPLRAAQVAARGGGNNEWDSAAVESGDARHGGGDDGDADDDGGWELVGNDEIETLMRGLVPNWSVHETLPAVGLDSLDIVQMRSSINKELGLSVPLSIFNRPTQTLGELLARLRDHRHQQQAA